MAEKLSTKVYEGIRKDIISGAIGPKTFLNEGEVGAKFGVSRAPVRDAYTHEELNKMQEIRVQLEKLSIRLAIKNATDEEIESLRMFTKEQYHGLEPEQSNNFRFHMRLAELGKNEFLAMQLKDLVNKSSMADISNESDLKKHEAIIDALAERDEEKACRKLVEDINFF